MPSVTGPHVLGGGQGQREEEVAPGEEEGEQRRGDQRVPADRQHDRDERPEVPAPSTRAASTSDGGMRTMKARMIRIANGMPRGRVGEDQPGDGVQQAEVVVGACRGRWRSRCPGIICEISIASSATVDPAEPELRERVCGRGRDRPG